MYRRIPLVLAASLLLLAIPLALAQQNDDSAPGGRGQGRRGRFGRAAAQPDDTAGFVAILNSQSLDNWDGAPRFWRVEDAAIVGQTTPDKPLDSNTFLIWRGGTTADFELKLEYKITTSGNSISPVDFIRMYYDRITYLHLKDRKFDNGPHMPWGDGDTPIRQVLELTKSEGYPFMATIELEHPVPHRSDVMTELAKCVEYCREALA